MNNPPYTRFDNSSPWLIRGVTTTVTLIRNVKHPQIQPIHQVAHMMRKVPLRQPVMQIRRQQ